MLLFNDKFLAVLDIEARTQGGTIDATTIEGVNRPLSHDRIITHRTYG